MLRTGCCAVCQKKDVERHAKKKQFAVLVWQTQLHTGCRIGAAHRAAHLGAHPVATWPYSPTGHFGDPERKVGKYIPLSAAFIIGLPPRGRNNVLKGSFIFVHDLLCTTFLLLDTLPACVRLHVTDAQKSSALSIRNCRPRIFVSSASLGELKRRR